MSQNPVSIQTIVDRLNRLSGQAMDPFDRSPHGESDEYLRGNIAQLLDLVDCCVWSRSSDFESAELKPLEYAHESARKAWSYLRSGAPDIQRKLRSPDAEAFARIAKIYERNRRYTSGYCRVSLSEKAHGVFEYLKIPRPGDERVSVGIPFSLLLYRCKDLAAAKFILSAVGLVPSYTISKAQTVRCLVCEGIEGEEIYFSEGIKISPKPNEKPDS